MSTNCPLELWLQVFHELVGSSAPLTKKELNKGATWLSATYVCREWRELMLSSTRIWSHWSFAEAWHPDMLATFLQRSKSAPLSVIIEKRSRWTAQKLRQTILMLAKPEISQRIEYLYIPSLNTELGEWYRAFTAPAPSMRSLHLEHDDIGGPDPPDIVSLFSGYMPSLQDLYIEGVSIPWMPAAYKNLTKLELHRQMAPSLDDVLESLRSSPNLEVLTLKFITELTSWTPSVSCRSPKIRLEHLKHLTLGSHPEHYRRNSDQDLFVILDHISFPDATSIQMEFVDSLAPLRDLTYSCSMLTRRSSKADYVTLKMGPEYMGSCVKVRSTLGSDQYSSIQLVWYWCHDIDDHNLLPPVLEYTGTLAIPLPEVRTLVISDYNFNVSGAEWSAILRSVPKLSHLRLHSSWSCKPFLGLFAVLGTTFEATDVEGTESGVLCPDLTRISLPVSPWNKQADEPWADPFIAALQARSDAGKRLSTLTLMILPAAIGFSWGTFYSRFASVVDQCSFAPETELNVL